MGRVDTVSIETLRQLAHLDVSNLNGREVPFHPLHDGAKWHLWIVNNDKLIPITAIPVESCYFSTATVGEHDLYVLFLDFLQQRAMWPDVARFVNGIEADVRNAGASLAKVRLIYDFAPLDASRMIVTEIEYVFLTCRSIFDLMQEIMVRLWDKVRLKDSTIKKAQLPSSYRKMVLREDKPMSAEEIAQRFGLPTEIAVIYAASTPFFLWLRAYRDLVAHSGHTVEHVLSTEKGFAIFKFNRPFRDMDIWTGANSLPNDLGSALSVIAHVLMTTFATCDGLVAALSRVIGFPPPIAPKHKIFICGPHLENLAGLQGMVRDKPWYDAPPKHGSETR